MPNSCDHPLVDEVDASERELGEARGTGVLVRRVEGCCLCRCTRVVSERDGEALEDPWEFRRISVGSDCLSFGVFGESHGRAAETSSRLQREGEED